jgi:O-antigen ligase
MAVAALGAVGLTLAHPSSTRQFTWPWMILLTLVWLTPVIAFLGSREPWRCSSRPLAAGLLLLVIATLTAALLSPFPQLSLLRVWPTVGGVALFFWLHHWLANSDPHARRLAPGLAAFGAALAVISLIGWRWHSASLPWSVRNDIPFGHSNYAAGAMLLVLPWLALAGWQSTGLRRLAWALAGLAALAVLLTTSSRAGALAFIAMVSMGAGFALWRASWPLRGKLTLVLVAALLLGLTVLTNPRLRGLAAGGGWSDVARESNTQRSAMLQAGALLGSERPLLGWGPGTVPLAYPLVRARLDGGVDNVLQLHNTPMQLWATLGTAGFIALGLLVLATLQRLKTVARTPAPLPLTAAAALLAYGLFALTDHQLDLPALNALLVLNLALLWHDQSPPISPSRGDPTGRFAFGRRMLAGALLALLIIPLWLTGRDLHARHAHDQALAALADDRPADGLKKLEAAAQRATYDPYYRHLLADRLLGQRHPTADASAREPLGAAAAEQLRLSLATGVFGEYAHLNLAWLALEAGSPLLAGRHFPVALALAPHRGGAYFGLGLALRETGQLAAAVRAFALEWINDPVAATDPIWQHPDFAPYRPAISREAGAILDELAPAHPTAAYIGNLWRWWEQGGPPPPRGFNHESNQFVTALTRLGQDQPLPAGIETYAWGRLLRTWQKSPADFSSLTPRDPLFAATLARRAARHPAPAVHGFLAAGPEGETNLLLETRSTRPGYGVLALHPDGPPLSDLYVRQSHRVVSAFASTVFPPKGWLPARELLRRLPATTDTP